MSAMKVVTLLIILASAGLVHAQPATTQPVAVEPLIALAPKLSLGDPQAKSLDVQMVLSAGATRLQIRALYEAPDRHAMYVGDARDGTPIGVVNDSIAIFYDPVDGALRVADGKTGELRCQQVEDKLNLKFGFNKPEQAWALDVDLVSVLKAERADAIELGHGLMGLRQRGRKGGILYCVIDPRSPNPYLRAELQAPDGAQAIVLDPILRDAPIDPMAFELPDREALAKTFTVKELDSKNIFGGLGGMQALTRLIMLRVAAGDPEEEKKLEKSLATRVDWKVVRENDQKLGPQVRALFPFATAQPRGLPATSPSSAPATR